MIPLDNLTNNAPPSARQQFVSRVPQIPEEALTFLAREIVREAGASLGGPDKGQPGQLGRIFDATRAHWNMHYDLAKQLGVASGVLLAGVVAVFGVFSPDVRFPGLALLAALQLVLAVILSILSMLRATQAVEFSIEQEINAYKASIGEQEE